VYESQGLYSNQQQPHSNCCNQSTAHLEKKRGKIKIIKPRKQRRIKKRRKEIKKFLPRR
jgi:hypothetical protein